MIESQLKSQCRARPKGHLRLLRVNWSVCASGLAEEVCELGAVTGRARNRGKVKRHRGREIRRVRSSIGACHGRAPPTGARCVLPRRLQPVEEDCHKAERRTRN